MKDQHRKKRSLLQHVDQLMRRSGRSPPARQRWCRRPGMCWNRRVSLAEQFLSHPEDRTALEGPFGTITYRGLQDRVARWRGALQAQGLNRGDRVVLISGNDDVFVTAYVSLLGLGVITVPLNPQSPAAELAREISAVAPSAAIVGSAGQAMWDEAIGDGLSGTPAIDLVSLDDGRPLASVDSSADDIALLLFTSGTAGMPKPAVLTHGNLDASLRAMLSLPVDLLGVHHVALVVVPLFHVFGINTMINLGLRIGATLVLDGYRSPEQVGDLVAGHGVTLLAGPPTLWLALSRSSMLEPQQFGSLDLAISGAAKLDPAVHEAVVARIGVDVKEGYGLTETCAVVATAVGTDAQVGSVGGLLAGVEVRLVDESDNDVLVGDPGELWVRGPMVSPGYAEVPSGSDRLGTVTGNRDDDGWLHTGDVAVVDDHGHLAIVDRLNDLVIVSGFNVFPGEVEAVLRAHESVAEAAVVGEPDPSTGEALVAYVVPSPDAVVDHDSLLDHCRDQLARYKVPRRVEVRQHLPLGLGGKIRRNQLR